MMKQIKPEETEGKTVKVILEDGHENILIIFKDDTYIYIYIGIDSSDPDAGVWIDYNKKPKLTDFYQKDLIEAGFASADDIDKAKQEQEEDKRNSRFRQYLELKKEFKDWEEPQ